MPFSCLRRFLHNRNGNVAIIFSLSALPIVFAFGMSLDYGVATKRRVALNAAADAAALSAVTPNMMSQTSSVAQLKATNFFIAQAANVSGVSYQPSDVVVQVSDSTVNGAKQRAVTVSYKAGSANAFSTLLHQTTMPIGGSSSSTATVPPDIDFYLMLDTSPSMAIAATQAGINTMVAATPSQGGCAFACHQTNPGADGLSQDNYSLARSLNVTLRIDLVSQAVQNLMSTAQTTSSNNGAAYRMSGYTFDVAARNVIPLTSNMTTAQNMASTNIQLLQVWSNNYLTQTNANNDQDTNFDAAFNTLNANMPNPGNGTRAIGDSPQEVLFIVTDGVADEAKNGTRIYTPFGSDPTWCATIRNRNIRIAVLYTTYYPLPTNSWYNTYIAGEQPSIGTTARACATPGLYFEVNTGGDISAAMSALFRTAVATAHLTH